MDHVEGKSVERLTDFISRATPRRRNVSVYFSIAPLGLLSLLRLYLSLCLFLVGLKPHFTISVVPTAL